MSKTNSQKILIGLTGSIACYKTCTVISQLVQSGREVEVIATPSALQFVGKATLEGLTGRKVHTDFWQDGQHMSHIQLGRWADVLVIAPLTALHVNKLALGLCDDLLTATYMAFEKTKPIIFAPAMNHEMYTHETVEKNLALLEERPLHKVLHPRHGILACKDEGFGKMDEPETILAAISAATSLSQSPTLAESPVAQMSTSAEARVAQTSAMALPPQQNEPVTPNPVKGRVLITYGGTREPIDGVRFLTNASTGQTGAALAEKLQNLNWTVDILKAESATQAKGIFAIDTFVTHADLKNKLLRLVSEKHYDMVIHLAAVSDFTVGKILTDESTLTAEQMKLAKNQSNKKIASGQRLHIELQPTDKIVNQIKTSAKNKKIKVIAFKLTHTLDANEQLQAAFKLLQSEGVDYVVQNDLNQISHDRRQHEFQIYGHQNQYWQAKEVSKLTEVLSGLMS